MNKEQRAMRSWKTMAMVPGARGPSTNSHTIFQVPWKKWSNKCSNQLLLTVTRMSTCKNPTWTWSKYQFVDKKKMKKFLESSIKCWNSTEKRIKFSYMPAEQMPQPTSCSMLIVSRNTLRTFKIVTRRWRISLPQTTRTTCESITCDI